MTSLFFGKKKEEKPKDSKDPKNAPAPQTGSAQDLTKVKVSAKDSLVKDAAKDDKKEKKDKDKAEKKEKKEKDKDKDKHKPEDEMPPEEVLNALFSALLVRPSC